MCGDGRLALNVMQERPEAGEYLNLSSPGSFTCILGPRSGFLPPVSDGDEVGGVSGPDSTWPTGSSLRKRLALRRSRSTLFLLTAVVNVPCWVPPLCTGLDTVKLVASATASARANT